MHGIKNLGEFVHSNGICEASSLCTIFVVFLESVKKIILYGLSLTIYRFIEKDGRDLKPL